MNEWGKERKKKRKKKANKKEKKKFPAYSWLYVSASGSPGALQPAELLDIQSQWSAVIHQQFVSTWALLCKTERGFSDGLATNAPDARIDHWTLLQNVSHSTTSGVTCVNHRSCQLWSSQCVVYPPSCGLPKPKSVNLRCRPQKMS